MVNLKLVKNDSYEKGTDLMVVNVYMKEICRQTSRVLFREQDFTLIFQTRWESHPHTVSRIKFSTLTLIVETVHSDPNFLRLHPDCGPNTVFKWQVKLRWDFLMGILISINSLVVKCVFLKVFSLVCWCFRNLIQPDQSSYAFTPSRIDITLKKRHSQRWGGLEAPATQGLLPGFYLLLSSL